MSAEATSGDISALLLEDISGNGAASIVTVTAPTGRAVRRCATQRVRSTANLATRAIRYFAEGAGALISGGSIIDVDCNMSGGALECIYLHGSTGGVVENIAVDSARTTGGTQGLRLLGANDISLGQLCRFSAPTTAAIDWGAGTGNRGGMFTGSAVYDPASLADGAGATTTVTVTGAQLGDSASATFSLDLQGITLTAWVSAANTVSARFQNETGAPIDLASGTLRAMTTKVGS